MVPVQLFVKIKDLNSNLKMRKKVLVQHESFRKRTGWTCPTRATTCRSEI